MSRGHVSVLALLALGFMTGCAGGSSGGNSVNGSGPAPILGTAAVVTSVSPNTVQAGAAATTIQVSGSSFVSASIVTFNGVQRVTTYSSATALSAIIPASALASGNTAPIGVINPNAGASTTVPFEIDNPNPVLTSISPSTTALGSAGTFTLTGTGFVPTSTVTFNGTTLTSTYVSATSLQLSLSASNLASAGTDTISVVNLTPAGGTSLPGNLTVTQPVPAVSGISPATILIGSGAVTITITGNGFTSTATVAANGTALAIIGQSSSSITATLPASIVNAAGLIHFVVTNPGTNPESSASVSGNIVGAPVVYSIDPAGAPIQSPNLTVTVFGANFVSGSIVEWNEVPLSTQYQSSELLDVVIPAADLTSFTNGSVTVSTPVAYPASPGTATSAPTTFSTFLSLTNNDLVYNPTNGLLYASVPGSMQGSLGNCIVAIDPITGNIKQQIPVGSQPDQIAISSDGTQLFVGLDGAGAVRQVNLTTGQPGMQFSLGGGPGVYNPPYTAVGLAAVPGEPNSVAVFSTSGIVTIYDSGVSRANTSSGLIDTYFDENYGAITFGSSASTLYVSAEPFQGVVAMTVGPTGITAGTDLSSSVVNGSIQFDSGHLYLPDGVVLNAASGSQAGTFYVTTNVPAAGPIVSDSTLGLAFVASAPINGAEQVLAFDESNFNPTSSIGLSGAITANGSTPFQEIVRWGKDGLALNTPTQIYVLQSSVVQNLAASPADLSVTLNPPSAASTGAAITYTATIRNLGPSQALGITFSSPVDQSLIVNSVAPSQGSCGSGSVYACDLGNLASGASATVTFNVTPTVSETLASTASVSSVSYDPTPSNNQYTASTVVSGNLYSAVPSVAGISPALVQAGAGAFTLTVTGSGFNSSSTVNLNGEPLPTIYASNTQLTATVSASDSATYGWASITVSNPSPGGGASQIVPLTIYALVNLSPDSIAFDPYTRKIYATLPSSSTAPVGNSLVTVDPVTGNVGTPINIGSQPTVMAESGDGNDLYIVLSGANSLAQFNLPTQQLVATIPVPTNIYSNSAPTAIAVMPGDDTTLAVDTSDIGYDGIFDITGSTGAFRSSFGEIYGGNDPTFSDASHFYTFDNYTTGAEFYRYGVDAGGVYLVDGTTLDGLGGFSTPFVLANGIVYGGSGGIINPSTNPPSQIATLSTSGLFGDGLAVDAPTGKVFLALENAAGEFSYTLARYNTTQYIAESMLPLPANNNGDEFSYNMLRWGQDGMVLQESSYDFATSTTISQVILLRGPFVLPSELNANAAPNLTGASPTTLAVNSGNTNLTIDGSNFLPAAVALWNGQPRTTTYVDSGHVSVAIPASDLTSAQTVSITAQNPGSASSNAISLPVN
jgi:sugar lactone lactonase YvrE